ncbi:hypothetical protein J3R30DRAFT_3346927 [Lentinula aciculospora]|uniref:HMG box domain-containing protein n=1 Tax=Lentinula aciculospora TaxID=153920 RepID=A0A9W8ZVR8_9AGAR|nr:hypothetical protein J3R30DRAFT_3346927 [Lentinula aciculospora]
MPKDTSPPFATMEKQPKRPPNAWILFRSDMNRALKLKYPKATQSVLSKQISDLWASAIPEVRAEYERRAEAAKVAHHLKYPNYKFNPRKKEEIAREKQARLQAKEERAKRNNARNAQRTPVDHTQMPQIPSLYPTLADFGPNGPSPPVSAAGSPQDFSSREASPAQFPTPSLTLPDPSSSESQQAFSPFTAPDVSLAGLSNWANPSAQFDAPSGSEEYQYNALLQFDLASQPIGQSFHQPMIGSSSQEPSHNMGVALMGTGDSSVFHVDPFDNGIIDGQQNLDLNIGVGDLNGLFGMTPWDFNQTMDQYHGQFSENIDFEALFSSLDDTSLVTQTPSHDMGNNMPSQSSSYGNDAAGPSSGSYGSYIVSSPSESACIQPSALASTSSQTFEQGPASGSSYAPPSGALYAGNRRVGGNWTQYGFPSDDRSQSYAVPAAAQ